MTVPERLPRDFFARPTLTVARELLGARLVRIEPDGQRTAGIIVETEAYIGEEDQGCHARAGRTPRTAVMYGPPGHAYVYFTYGMHWLFNVVTEQEGFPAAVLVRALLPTEGLERMAARRRNRPRREWTNGPAKLCQALAIDGSFHGADLCTPEAMLFLEPAVTFPDESVTTGPRVGLNTVPEPWKSIPWRFMVRSPHLFLT
ncbi:MAG: DNA-3-methyladenine glycosylase [Chloroflexi bacterium]|nr:DNA-3-methyladenine glycosylase [Chloroflexota bacterium]